MPRNTTGSVIEAESHTLSKKLPYDIGTGLLTAVIVAGAPFCLKYLRMDLVQNILIIVLLLVCVLLLWLWRKPKGTVSAPPPAEQEDGDTYSSTYVARIESFSTLSDQIGEVLQGQQDVSEETSMPTYLLHWVPTFALSRGLDNAAQMVRPQHSPTYKSLRDSLITTRGRLICFEGRGIYQFLYESGLLNNDPLLTSSYLEEVIDILSDERIKTAFLTWGIFPYTLIAIGAKFAVFDFTTINDIKESEGFRRASIRPTLRLETENPDEVNRVRHNMFLSIYDQANKDPELLTASVDYLKDVSEILRTTKRLVTPAEAQRRFWKYNTNK